MKRCLIHFSTLCVLFSVSISLGGVYSGGTGKVEDPYQLSTGQDILELTETEGNWGSIFILTDNIDLEGIDIKPFTQDLQNGFSGTIDGKGFAIKNMTIKGVKGRYVGLFGILSNKSIIRNLDMFDVNIDVTTPEEIEKDDYVYVGAFAGISRGMILNCKVTGKIQAVSKELTSVGGFVGRLEGAVVDRCYSAVSIRAFSLDQCFAGGMIGYTNGANLLNNISNSNVYAEATDRTYAGSVVGYSLHTGFNSTCSDEGKIITDCKGYSGGLAGYCYKGQIINCYAANDVFSFSNGFAGGITGGNYNSIVRNCYFDGRMSLDASDSHSGTIVGFNAKSQILNCFWVYDSSLADKAIAEGVFIGNVNMFTRKQILYGDLFDEKEWNIDTPKDSLEMLWTVKSGQLPILNRTATVSED